LFKKGPLIGYIGKFELVKYGQYKNLADLNTHLENIHHQVVLSMWAPSPLSTMVSIAKTDDGQKALSKIVADMSTRFSQDKVVRGESVLRFLEVAKCAFEGTFEAFKEPVPDVVFKTRLSSLDILYHVIAGDKAIVEVLTTYLQISTLTMQLLIALNGFKGDWMFLGAHELARGRENVVSDSYGMFDLTGSCPKVPFVTPNVMPISTFKKTNLEGGAFRVIPETNWNEVETPYVCDLRWDHVGYVLTKENSKIGQSKYLGTETGRSDSSMLYTGPLLVHQGKACFDRAVVVAPLSTLAKMGIFEFYHVRVILGPMSMIHCVILVLDRGEGNVKNPPAFAGFLRAMILHRLDLFASCYSQQMVGFEGVPIWHNSFLKQSTYVRSLMDAVNVKDFRKSFEPPVEIDDKKEKVKVEKVPINFNPSGTLEKINAAVPIVQVRVEPEIPANKVNQVPVNNQPASKGQANNKNQKGGWGKPPPPKVQYQPKQEQNNSPPAPDVPRAHFAKNAVGVQVRKRGPPDSNSDKSKGGAQQAPPP